MKRIRMKIGAVEATAVLHDTPTAAAVWQALPFNATAQTWGEEVYFATPVSAEPEADARRVVETGELAFWLAGSAIAVCYGPTPVSTPDEIRLISDANIFGRLEGDPKTLAAARDGDPISVEKLNRDQSR